VLSLPDPSSLQAQPFWTLEHPSRGRRQRAWAGSWAPRHVAPTRQRPRGARSHACFASPEGRSGASQPANNVVRDRLAVVAVQVSETKDGVDFTFDRSVHSLSHSGRSFRPSHSYIFPSIGRRFLQQQLSAAAVRLGERKLELVAV
jgi:hypothetical protein